MPRRSSRPAAARPDPAGLPPGFAELLAPVLGDELAAFLAALSGEPQRAVRANRARVSAAELAELLGWAPDDPTGLPAGLAPLPWCPDGLPVPAGDSAPLGRHPAHLAGLCYLQEPSSMAAVTALDPQPGWRVADLAAAPGGKTTQLASLVGPSGLVVANEVVTARLAALHDNLDRWGATNVVTTSGPIERIPVPPGGYDGVLLDAPCTGEGLWRRDPAARHHWSPAAVAGAAQRQAELLARAAALVPEGGVLVYSTCTFNRAENEDRLVELLTSTDAGGWELDDLAWLGASPSLASDLAAPTAPDTHRAARFWPHRGQGEGQFVARLRRRQAPAAPGSSRRTPLSGDTEPGRGPSSQTPLSGHDDARGSTHRAPMARHDEAGYGRRVPLSGHPDAGRRPGGSVPAPGTVPLPGAGPRRVAGQGRGERRGGDRSALAVVGPPDPELLRSWEAFRAATVPRFAVEHGLLRVRAGWLFALPATAADLIGGSPNAGAGPGGGGREAEAEAALRRPGLPLGRLRPGRFEPHPALATALVPTQAAEMVSWDHGQPELAAYLRGETVAHPGPDGWVLVCYRRWGLGWARRSRGVLKNAFPTHLRRQAAGLPLGR